MTEQLEARPAISRDAAIEGVLEIAALRGLSDGRGGAGARARRCRARAAAPAGGGRARARWASASSSSSISRSSAASRTTPVPCSSCSTPAGRCAPSAAAAATTACCRRSAASISRRWASAWATWCWASCCGSAGWLPAETLEHRRLPRGRHRGRSADVLALAHELRDAGLRVEYALGAQAVGKQLKLADARHARARGGGRAGRPGAGRGDA